MSLLMHLIGLCPDHAAHLSLLDLVAVGGFSITMAYHWLCFYIRGKRVQKEEGPDVNGRPS